MARSFLSFKSSFFLKPSNVLKQMFIYTFPTFLASGALITDVNTALCGCAPAFDTQKRKDAVEAERLPR